MDDSGPTASIVWFVCLILVDMFFYGFGAAIHSINNKEIEKKALEEKDKKSERLLKIMADPSRFVNTVQLVVTLINLIIGSFYLQFWLKYIHSFLITQTEGFLDVEMASRLSLLVTGTVLIYVILTFGVLLPKKIASRYPEKWAYFCITPVYYVTGLLSPLTGIVTLTAGGVARLFGIKPDAGEADVTEEEIISMVNEGHEQGVLQASEAEMITNIFEFGDKEAQDIMTHRKNIIAIDGDMPLGEAIDFMLGESKSRYPVYDGDIDHIIGILHFKDAVRARSVTGKEETAVKKVKNLLREVKFIPETRNIDALFHNMQSLKIQMVIVIDEYGQTAGLIAMEDILEEIVGNIMDEYDEDEEHIEEKSENEYIIEGLTPLEELEKRFTISFKEEEFETLNGFLISKMDKIPEENENFDIDVEGYNFKVLSVKNKMIETVLVTRTSGEAEKIKETSGETLS